MNERKPSNGELEAVAYIFGLQKECKNDEKYMKELLKDVPDGWRRFRLASSTLGKLRDDIWAVLPDRHMRHLKNLSDYGETVIRPRPFVRTDDVQFVDSNVLKRLVNIIVKDECSMCLKTGKEARRCPIYRDISIYFHPTIENNDYACPFTNVILNADYGKYMKE